MNFVKGGPELPEKLQTEELKSWTEWNGATGKAFSGTASYSINLAKPQADAAVWRLDLGRGGGQCAGELNGEALGTLIAGPFTIDIPADKFREQNRLEISVSNLMANRIADMDRQGVAWKRFYNVNFAANDAANRGPDKVFTAAKWEPRTSGLIGPVTLRPMEKFDPSTLK